MIIIAIVIGCIIGALIGMNAPMIPYTYSTFLAIAVVAALDSVFGGITSVLKKNFDLTIFISGFFCNSILSIALTYLGQKLNLDIYLAAIGSICRKNVYKFDNNKKVLHRKMDRNEAKKRTKKVAK